MTYTEREDESVALEMSKDEWYELLFVLGYATGSASKNSDEEFYKMVEFTNRLNATNPRFAQYEIPEVFKRK